MVEVLDLGRDGEAETIQAGFELLLLAFGADEAVHKSIQTEAEHNSRALAEAMDYLGRGYVPILRETVDVEGLGKVPRMVVH